MWLVICHDASGNLPSAQSNNILYVVFLALPSGALRLNLRKRLMTKNVHVVGVGMIPFVKPGANKPYPEMAAEAVNIALKDAGITYDKIQQAYVGYVYGDSTSGQRALYEVGMTGIPVVNVNNNCSTGSTALFLARQAVQTGAAECVLALGFEQMNPGALTSHFNDRPSPFERFDAAMEDLVGCVEVPIALRSFGGAGLAHMQQFGTPMESFAKIRAKASRHAANNPLALFRNIVTTEEVMATPVMWPGVMTRLMACPPTCGAAAAIICSEEFAAKHGLDRSVRIRAQSMTTDTPSTFEAHDMRQVVGFGMAQAAAKQVYESAGIGPEDIDVVELHDCFAHNELITYESLGLCPIGGAEKFIDDGDNTYGGKVVTNPSGGLLSKGHPLGATGLAQCTELVQQLRGTADKRQVESARLALQHNLGLGGACVITLYEKA
jgi:acetyl-CoA acetyltransferase